MMLKKIRKVAMPTLYLSMILILLVSHFQIPNVEGIDTYHFIDQRYEVDTSTDDAYYVEGSDFITDNDALVLKAREYESDVALRFINVTRPYTNCTIDSAYISFRQFEDWDQTYDTIQPVTIFGIDEGNTSTFINHNFTDYYERPTTFTFTNWDIKDMYENGTWGNSSSIKILLTEIVNRPDWSSGNSIGLKIFSNDGEMILGTAYDYNVTHAPRLFIRWKYTTTSQEGVGGKWEFIEKYGGYEIWKYSDWVFEYQNNTVYNVTTMKTNWIDYVYNKRHIVISEAKDMVMIFGFNETWLQYYVALDGINFQLYNVSISETGITAGELDVYLWEDTEHTYVHILYGDQGLDDKNLYYYMIEINNDGSFGAKSPSPQIVKDPDADDKVYGRAITATGSGYPVVMYYCQSDADIKVSMSSNKAGTWTTEAGFPRTHSVGTLFGFQVMPMKDDDSFYALCYRADVRVFKGAYWNGTHLDTHDYPDIDDPVRRPANSNPHATITEDDDIIIVYGTSTEQYDICYTIRWANGSYVRQEELHNGGGTKALQPVILSGRSYYGENTVYVFVSADEANPESDIIVYWRSNEKGRNYDPYVNWIDQQIPDVFENDIETTVWERDSTIAVVWEIETPRRMQIAYLGIYSAITVYRAIDPDTGAIICEEPTIAKVKECIDEWNKPESKMFRNLGNTIMWMIGLGGLIMMPLGLVMFVIIIKTGDIANAFFTLMVLFIIGMGLFIAWIWG